MKKILLTLLLALGGAGCIMSQGPGGPPMGGPGGPGGPGQAGQFGPGPGPGGPGGPGAPPAPAPASPPPGAGIGPLLSVFNNPPVASPNWQNSGTITVMACGYDAQGVWRTIPLRVSYNYNGAQYNVTVLSAWNPWTDNWNLGIDVPAFNTSYFLNGVNYDFYTNLSTGTFYFNL